MIPKFSILVLKINFILHYKKYDQKSFISLSFITAQNRSRIIRTIFFFQLDIYIFFNYENYGAWFFAFVYPMLTSLPCLRFCLNLWTISYCVHKRDSLNALCSLTYTQVEFRDQKSAYFFIGNFSQNIFYFSLLEKYYKNNGTIVFLNNHTDIRDRKKNFRKFF